MNNKGFMMAEVIVVSSIVLVTLVAMYTSYSKIFALYNQRVNYYDVATLYELSYVRSEHLNEWEENGVYTVEGNTILYVNKNKIKNKSVNMIGLKQTFKDYLNYLSTSLDFDGLEINGKLVDNILVMESCSDENNCKYAYLETGALK